MGWFRHGVSPANLGGDSHFMYVFTGYADEAAAKADLAEFVNGSDNWHTNVIADITVTDESGYSVAVGTPDMRDDLYRNFEECRIEFNLKAKMCNRSKILYRALETTTITGIDSALLYHDWHPNGLLPPKPIGPITAWPYMRVDGPEVFLHHNNDAFVANWIAQKNAAAIAVNGGGGTLGGGPSGGGGSYTLPMYVQEPDTPIRDIVPSNNDPHPLYAGSAGVEYETVICADVGIPVGATPAGGTDRQIGFYNPFATGGDFREFWIFREPTTNNYTANRGGLMDNIANDTLIYHPTFGVAATSLPQIVHQIQVDEYFYHGLGYSPHAIGWSYINGQTNAVHTWPAARSDGTISTRTSPNQIPEGARFRWDPEHDIDAETWHPMAKYILKTVQKYGGVITDRAGSLGTSVENEKHYLLQGGGLGGLYTQKWPEIFNSTAFYQIFDGVDWSHIQFLPNDWGRPTWRPTHIPGCAHWFSCANVNNLITNSGQSFQPMTGAWDISSNSVELGVVSSALAPDYWSNGWPNKTLPSARFNRDNDERLITNQAKRLQLGADCTKMAMAGAASARTAWAANARIMSIRATGQTNDDDNDGSCYFGVNSAGTHLIWKNNATTLTVAALPALNTDFVWMVVCDGTEATPFFGTAGSGWTAGTPAACTSTFGDESGEADIAYGNTYQGGNGFTGAIPFGTVWAQDDSALTAPVDNYLDTWVTT